MLCIFGVSCSRKLLQALGKDEKELIVSAPRQRKKRFEPSEQAEEESGDDRFTFFKIILYSFISTI